MCSSDLRDEVAEEFINQYGAKAVPVSNQEDIEGMKKRGYKAVIVSEAKKKIILESELYSDVKQELKEEQEKARPLYDRFCEFAEKIENKLTEDEVATLYGFLDEVQDREEE